MNTQPKVWLHAWPLVGTQWRSGLDRLRKVRTVFVVAHRLFTVRRADVLLLMDDSRIVVRGTYDELLAGNGHYARFCELQFRPQSHVTSHA